MSTPSGTISMNDVNVELGRQGTASINFNDSGVRTIGNLGGGAQTTPGTTLSMDQLRSKAYNSYQLNGTYADFNLINALTAAGKYVAGRTYGVLNIASGSILGASSVGSYGLTIQGASGDTFIVQNAGIIVGKGGDGGLGTYSNPGPSQGGQGQNGGAAMLVQGAQVVLYNVGIIGGGGGGGNGGLGYEDRQRPRRGHGGAGGGGGAGYYVGAGGADAGGGVGFAGTLFCGGAPGGYAGQAYNGGGQGGYGGGLAQAGGAGQQGSPTTPGAGGASINGSNWIQFAQSGDIRGAQNSA